MSRYSFFRLPDVCLYGPGSFSQVGRQAARYGQKALIVSDPVIADIGYVDDCTDNLSQAGVQSVIYARVDSEPTDIHVKEALETYQKHNCDVIIAIGGGSSLDTAKAVAVIATNGGYIGDYRDGKRSILHDPVPLLCLPTTAGTGSEVTDVTVITNTSSDVKMMIKHPAFLPKVAIINPALTKTSPPSVTAATGVDALCHAIEAYISRRSQPLTDTLALSAIRKIIHHIEVAYQKGDNMEAREQMAIAAMEAGAAFSNASVCLVHGMSRPIGAIFHVPHGVSNAMLLPAVLEFSRDHCIERLAVIGHLFDGALTQAPPETAAEEAISRIKALCRKLDIPSMKRYGIDRIKFEQQVEKMAIDALDSGSPGNNPRIPRKAEIISLYHRCYDYQF